MKVTLVGPVYPYRGGIAHYTTQLALSLRANGHTCRVISFSRQYPGWLYPGGSDKDPSQSSVLPGTEFLIDPFSPLNWLQACRSISQQAPDLVVLQWWTTYWTLPFTTLARRLRRRQVKVVYLVHNIFPHEQKPWDRSLVKLALTPASGFIVQTEHQREHLCALLPQAVYECSPHPIYTMLNEKRIDRSEARRKLGLPLDKLVLLFFGIVRPYKGLRYLIDALAILKAQDITPMLLVAGDFWHGRDDYQKQIDQYDLSGQIRMDDRYIPDEDAALMFSAADGLVAPYVDGTQSGVAGLASGFGLPIIATDLVAAGLSAVEPGLVRVVPPANAAAIAEAIRELIAGGQNDRPNPLGVKDNWWTMVEALEKLTHRLTQAGPCA